MVPAKDVIGILKVVQRNDGRGLFRSGSSNVRASLALGILQHKRVGKCPRADDVASVLAQFAREFVRRLVTENVRI